MNNIANIMPGRYTVEENGYRIYFAPEYKNGLYFKIISATNISSGRCYQSPRYTRKFIPIIRETSFHLLKKGDLWDHATQRPALDTYREDIASYHAKCETLDIYY